MMNASLFYIWSFRFSLSSHLIFYVGGFTSVSHTK
jgi:vomeronasal1 receptor